MAYRESPDSINDYIKKFESIARESLYRLLKSVVETLSYVSLRKPSLNDMQPLYVLHEEIHGFPNVIGSIG